MTVNEGDTKVYRMYGVDETSSTRTMTFEKFELFARIIFYEKF